MDTLLPHGDDLTWGLRGRQPSPWGRSSHLSTQLIHWAWLEEALGGIRDVDFTVRWNLTPSHAHRSMATPRVFSALAHVGEFFRWRLAAQPLIPLRSYKVRSSLKLRCSSCRFVKRKGRVRVVCDRKPRHKQKQGWWCRTPKSCTIMTSSMVKWHVVHMNFNCVLVLSVSRLHRTANYVYNCMCTLHTYFQALPVDKTSVGTFWSWKYM